MSPGQRWLPWRCSGMSHIHMALATQIYMHGISKRYYSATPPPTRPPSFFGKIVDNLKEELARDKKMKESLKEFRKEMETLEKSEALKKAREKYETVESETAEGTKKAKKQMDFVAEQVKEKLKEAQNTEILQKASKITEAASERAQKVGESIAQKGEEISKTQTYKAISETAKAVKEEIDSSAFGGAGARVYRAPQVLRKRLERDSEAEQRIIQADTESTGMTLHKDSQFSQSWQNFKDNNAYVNRVMEWKTKLDESENPIVRASVLVKDKVGRFTGDVLRVCDSGIMTDDLHQDRMSGSGEYSECCEQNMCGNIQERLIQLFLVLLLDASDGYCWQICKQCHSMLTSPVSQHLQVGFLIHCRAYYCVRSIGTLGGKALTHRPIICARGLVMKLLSVTDHELSVTDHEPSSCIGPLCVQTFCNSSMILLTIVGWSLLVLRA
ncbi:unnamed protein product, partial [Meganyctiphanes norvegica]